MLSKLFTFLEMHSVGIFTLFLCLFTVVLFVQWLAWIFSLGRFRVATRTPSTRLRFIVAEFFVTVINDFRHLLSIVPATLDSSASSPGRNHVRQVPSQ